MRYVQKIDPDKQEKIKRSIDRDNRLTSWTEIQIEDAISKRFWQDEAWRICLRQYEAIPDIKDRKRPYSEQVIIEIPLGAKMCDTIVSAMTELLFGTNPN